MPVRPGGRAGSGHHAGGGSWHNPQHVATSRQSLCSYFRPKPGSTPLTPPGANASNKSWSTPTTMKPTDPPPAVSSASERASPRRYKRRSQPLRCLRPLCAALPHLPYNLVRGRFAPGAHCPHRGGDGGTASHERTVCTAYRPLSYLSRL